MTNKQNNRQSVNQQKKTIYPISQLLIHLILMAF